MEFFTSSAFIIGVTVFVAFMVILFIVSRMYVRADKDTAYIRTGFGGDQVIKDAGGLVIPILHSTMKVNLKTLIIPVIRKNQDGLITQDKMRADVNAEFYVRVASDHDSIRLAAQTLGNGTNDRDSLRDLIEGKFVDALRAVAAGMDLEELHAKREDFVKKVQDSVKDDLTQNGLELETVSLTHLDQTSAEHLDPNNAFDAIGLTKITKIVENNRQFQNKLRNDARVEISKQDLEAEQATLTIKQNEEKARLEQKEEIARMTALNKAKMAKDNETAEKEAEEARINREKAVETAEIDRQKTIENARIAKQREIEAAEIEKQKAIETAQIEKNQAIEIAEQEKAIVVANKSEETSKAEADAAKARALQIKEDETANTVRATEIANREKRVALTRAEQEEGVEAMKITVTAAAKKEAAQNEADSIITLAEANAKNYEVEAAGKRMMHDAENTLSEAIIEMRITEATIKILPAVMAEMVKPIEKIGNISIIEAGGLFGGNGNGNSNGKVPNGNAMDDFFARLQNYQLTTPVLADLLKRAGITDVTPKGILEAVSQKLPENPTLTEETNAEAEEAQEEESANADHSDAGAKSEKKDRGNN